MEHQAEANNEIEGVLNRRVAMKAALGGAAAVAVLNAPGIDRFTSAPAFAAECTQPVGGDVAFSPNGSGSVWCWGDYLSGSCADRTHTYTVGSNVVDVTLHNGPYSAGTATVTQTGGTGQCTIQFGNLIPCPGSTGPWLGDSAVHTVSATPTPLVEHCTGTCSGLACINVAMYMNLVCCDD